MNAFETTQTVIGAKKQTNVFKIENRIKCDSYFFTVSPFVLAATASGAASSSSS